MKAILARCDDAEASPDGKASFAWVNLDYVIAIVDQGEDRYPRIVTPRGVYIYEDSIEELESFIECVG